MSDLINKVDNLEIELDDNTILSNLFGVNDSNLQIIEKINDVSIQYRGNKIKISGNKGYPAPNRNWEAGTIKLDFTDDLNTRRRADHLKEWENNVSIMFSKKNLNKMRVAYGNKFVQQLENMLERMRTGKNRTGQNEIIWSAQGHPKGLLNVVLQRVDGRF